MVSSYGIFLSENDYSNNKLLTETHVLYCNEVNN